MGLWPTNGFNFFVVPLFNGYFFHDHRRKRPILLVCWTASNDIDDFLSLRDPSEDGIVGGQRIIYMHDKELRTVGVWTGIGHGNGPGRVAVPVKFRRGIDLIIKAATPDGLTPPSGSGWVPALDHKPFDDPVEDDSIIVALVGQGDKIFGRFRSIGFQQFKADGPIVGLNDSLAGGHDKSPLKIEMVSSALIETALLMIRILLTPREKVSTRYLERKSLFTGTNDNSLSDKGKENVKPGQWSIYSQFQFYPLVTDKKTIQLIHAQLISWKIFYA